MGTQTESNEIQEEQEDNEIELLQAASAERSNLCWVTKPDGYSLSFWRNIQVKKFLAQNPSAKGKTVLEWIRSHENDP